MPCSYLHRGTDFNRLVRTLEPSSVRRLVRVDSPRKPRNAGGPHGPGSLMRSLNLKEEEEREREREWQPSSVALAKEREREWLCGRKERGTERVRGGLPLCPYPFRKKESAEPAVAGVTHNLFANAEAVVQRAMDGFGARSPDNFVADLKGVRSSVEASIRLQEQLMQSAPKLHAPGLSQDSP